MALRNILKIGEERLRKHSRTVTAFDDRLHLIIDDMRDTLLDSGGVGLAAPQVGILRRIVLVMDTNKEELTDEEQIIELINPEIIEVSGSQTGPEGCLSVPGDYGIVTRPEEVTVKAQDRFGKWHEYTGEDLLARAFCHETEHLDGKMFMDLVTEWIEVEED